jgi:hypothetical protein
MHLLGPPLKPRDLTVFSNFFFFFGLLVYLNAAALTQVKTKKSIKKIVGKIKKLIHETYSGMKFQNG